MTGSVAGPRLSYDDDDNDDDDGGGVTTVNGRWLLLRL